MLTSEPWIRVGLAILPAVAAALVATLRSLLSGNKGRRKKVLANLDFISRLREYEIKDKVTLSPHVFDRAHADLARSIRIYVDRNSWQWIGAFLLMYAALLNVFVYTVALLVKASGWVSFVDSTRADLPSLNSISTLLSFIVVLGAFAMFLALHISATWSESLDAFKDRDNHLVPRQGPGLVRPLGKPQSILTAKQRKRLRNRLGRKERSKKGAD